MPDRRAAIAGVDGVQPQPIDDGVTQPEPDRPLDKAKLECVAVSRITRTADGVVSGEAQTLAAALNHSSFNAANAIGAWLGGSVLAAGLGLTAPIWVAVALTLAGMVLLAVSALVERRARAEVRSGYASAARI